MVCYCEKRGLRHWWKYLKLRYYLRKLLCGFPGPYAEAHMTKDEWEHWFVKVEDEVTRTLDQSNLTLNGYPFSVRTRRRKQ